MDWLAEVTVPARAAVGVATEWWLSGVAPVAIVETHSPDGCITLVAGYERRADAEAAARRVGGRVAAAPAVDWTAVHRGRPPTEIAGHVLDLEPGATFGWGGHPTTRLALDLLATVLPSRGGAASEDGRATVLDVGSGSGVLGIAARLLGSGRVLAIDVDEAAVAATRHNAARNGVGAALDVRRSDPSAVDDDFDIVLANLSAPTHLTSAAAIARCCGAGGALVVSGVLDGEERAVVGRYEAAGLDAVTAASLDGWAAAVLRRPGPLHARGHAGASERTRRG